MIWELQQCILQLLAYFVIKALMRCTDGKFQGRWLNTLFGLYILHFGSLVLPFNNGHVDTSLLVLLTC